MRYVRAECYSKRWPVTANDLPWFKSGLASLDPASRALAHQYLVLGTSIRQLSALTGMSVGQVRRRLRRLVRGFNSPEFRTFLRFRSELSPLERLVGAGIFGAGIPQRQLARRLGLSRYKLSRIVTRLDGWMRSHRGSDDRVERR